ncbi:MAG: hypothetical protein SVK54_08180 [candidate division WOR-3 bacterium]|nr:hypothetical protein [candidate division WOR-3 bacterium]
MKRTIIILTMGLILYLSCQNNNTASYYQTDSDEFYRQIEFDAYNKLKSENNVENSVRQHLFSYYVINRDTQGRIIHAEYIKKQRLSTGGFNELSPGIASFTINYMPDKDIFICTGRNADKVLSIYTFEKDGEGRYEKRIMTDMQNGAKQYIIYEYNNKGILIRSIYCDSLENPVLNHEDIAGHFYKYNKKDNLISERYLDIEGNITVKSNGIGGYNYYYNEDGQRIKTEIVGPNFNIVKTAKSEYNNDGMVKRAVFYDAGGNPLSGTGNVPVIEYEYDRYGNMTALIHKNMEGELVEDRQGVAKSEYKYKNGKIIINEFDKEGSQAIGFEVK